MARARSPSSKPGSRICHAGASIDADGRHRVGWQTGRRTLAPMKEALARLAGRRPPPRRLDPGTLPAGAHDALRADHPRLVELERRYALVDPAVTRPLVWDEARLSDEDLLWFRADNHFVWQLRGAHQTRRRYALVTRHLLARGHGPLLDRLGEDGAFGAAVFEAEGRRVSRDLLDAVGEIDFLRRHVGLGTRPLTLLDIGAGYGRLAWRIEQATDDGTRVLATDAFARSSFVCEHYLRWRGARRARAVPLDEIEGMLAGTRVDAAINVHSFSECTPEAVDWWAALLARSGVPRLMLIPNEGQGGAPSCEIKGGIDMQPILARHGFRRRVCEPRYDDPRVQARGIDPCWIFLFERE